MNAANFAARIAEAAVRFPAHIAIERTGGAQTAATSYATLIEHAGHWSAHLFAMGVRGGDRVAILGDNDEPWIAAYLGVLWLGAVAVPLDTAYSSGQLRTILDHCAARVLCATAKLAPRAAGIEGIRVVPLVNPFAGIAPPLAPLDGAAAAVILYTSGTTADPKGVVLTHANLDAERIAALSVVDCREDDAVLGVLPLFHALAQMANLLVPLSTGARVVFLETVTSAALVAALEACGITIFVCVPQFFYLIHQRVTSDLSKSPAVKRLLGRGLLGASGWLRRRAGWNVGRLVFARVHRALGSRMRLLITGGSRFDPAIAADLHAMGFTLLNGYGLTETSGAATVQRPADRFTTSVGPPLAGVEIRVEREAGDAISHSEAQDGEVLIRGAIVMREYFNRPDATADALRDGWLRTGDLGRIDREGRLYITGRKKEIIVLSSGKNLYPEEIESHYRQSPFVKELCVLGLSRPDEPSAERLHAVIVPDEDALKARGAVNVRELIRFEVEGLSVHLPAHKRILSYDIVSAPLPRTTTGKLKRHDIARTAHARRDTPDASRAPAEPGALTDDQRAWLSHPAHASGLRAIGVALGREHVAPEASLELDLGLDSMERVELLAAMERRAGGTLAADVRATIFTARQLVDALERLTALAPDRDAPPLKSQSPGAEWASIFNQPVDASIVAALDRQSALRALLFFVIVRTLRGVARLVFGFRPTGMDHLPKSGPVMLTPNHQSYIDGFCVISALPFAMLRRVFLVGAAEYFATPLSRWAARMANIVPVDPDANLVGAMQACAAGLRSQHVLILFPEGERTIDGRIKPFRKGAAILSTHLDVPVVPVAVDGLYALWPRSRGLAWRRWLPWRAPRVSLTFGTPLDAVGSYAEATERIQSAVTRLFDDLRENVPS